MKAFSESTANKGRIVVLGEVELVTRSIVPPEAQKRKRRLPEEDDDEKDAENIKEYLNKLQQIVPSLPKNKKIPKVEVIDHVIDYIHELRSALGLPQSCNDLICPNNRFTFMEETAVILSRKNRHQQQQPQHSL